MNVGFHFAAHIPGASFLDVDEAILLSDRIALMTNGTDARLAEIVNVTLDKQGERGVITIDLIARSLAEKMSASLGQPVVVENKPGASNNLGTDFVAKSPPDGYALIIVASSHATNKHLFKSLPYDVLKDFAQVATMGFTDIVVLTGPDTKFTSLADLLAFARS